MNHWNIDAVLNVLADEIAELERVRLEILAKRSKGWGLVLLTVGITFVLAFSAVSITSKPILLVISVVIGGIALIVISHSYFTKGRRDYVALFKHRFMPKVLQQVEPRLKYESQKGIEVDAFMGCGLFGQRPDRYVGEDLFSGMIGETQVAFCEIHAEEKRTRRDNNGKRQTYWVTIFKGIFFIADFHKEFRNQVTIMPDVAEKNFGWFGKKLQKLGGGVQRLENAEFEKYFVVRGADPVETRYLLTPKMQQALVDLRNRTNDGLRLSLLDRRIWIAIPNKADWFEPDFKKSVKDHTQLRSILSQMKACTNIVEELDLNTRIWTK